MCIYVHVDIYVVEVWASLVAQMVKNSPAMQEMWVRSLGWEDPLENRMATHSSILARKILWTEDPGRLQSMGLQRVRHSLATEYTHILYCLCWDSTSHGYHFVQTIIDLGNM